MAVSHNLKKQSSMVLRRVKTLPQFVMVMSMPTIDLNKDFCLRYWVGVGGNPVTVKTWYKFKDMARAVQLGNKIAVDKNLRIIQAL